MRKCNSLLLVAAFLWFSGWEIPQAHADQTIRLPVTRDTWFSAVGNEANANLGGAARLKLKSIQEMSLVDLDPAPLKGRTILSATLHVHRIGPEKLARVSVGTFASEWVEGTSASYTPEPGASTFNAAKAPNGPWAFPGSDLTAVMLGQGGTIWHSADASPPDTDDWQEIPVDPKVVAARVAGISYGFILFDDTGSEWTRDGEKFTLRNFPNRYIHSRDGGTKTAPYFTIEVGPEDHNPPGAPTELSFDATDLPAGEARVSWLTPDDVGPAGTIGFLVDVDGRAIPRYLIPAAGAPGSRVTMHVRDLGLTAGQKVSVRIRAVDGAGNVSSPATIDVKTSGQIITPLPGTNAQPLQAGGPLPKLGDAQIAIVDELDKVQPVTGEMIPPQDANYLSSNHLWDSKEIHLAAARNEFVAFQILIHGQIKDVHAALKFDGAPAPQATFYRFRHVQSKRGPVPDPLLPLDQRGVSVPAADERIENQQWGSLICEVYVPHEFSAGAHAATLTLTSAGNELNIPVRLDVWNFSLPDRLSFLPEMNCYGLPANERDYYRLAHENRTVLNAVPYSQNGTINDGCAPKWDPSSQKLDFAAWDRRFGPLFDGSAFADLPRKGVPIDCFYLPLHENWPTPMEGNYNGSYWADKAFPPAYEKAFVETSRQFAEHCNQRRWNKTIFQGFFNGKNNYKEHGWSHGSSPWLLDEPANFQDYWALHFFGKLFHEGISQAPGDARMLFRCDISRPQWQRDVLDDVLNYNVIAGGAFHQYHRLVMDRKQKFGQIVMPYGTTNNPADSNVQPAGWCLDSWTLGGDGVLPWQVIGSGDAWKRASDTSLFYPGQSIGLKVPVPSIRLKAYLRGQQDVEYLVLLTKQEKQSQLTLGQRVRAALPIHAQRHDTGFIGDEDAGVMEFSSLRPQDLWALRMRVGRMLSQSRASATR